MYQPRRAAAPDATTVPDPSSSAPRGTWTRLVASARANSMWLRRGAVAVSVVTVGALVAAAATLPQGTEPTEETAVSTQTAKAFAAQAPLAAPAAKPSSEVDKTIIDFRLMYASTWLTVREKADATSEPLGSITFAAQVWASDAVDGYRQVQLDDDLGWVPAKDLVDKLPDAPADVTLTPCPRGSSIEKKLRLDTVKIYRSVCALFPEVNSYGGWRSGGLPFHKNGRAVDIMLTPYKESAVGWRIANYLSSHAAYFRVDHIIFEQKIWTPSNPHWRHMADRGGITANHFNHVHVAIKA